MKTLVYLKDVLNIAMQYCPDDDGSCSEPHTDLRKMLDEIENLSPAQSEPQWTPASEGLPDPNKEEDACLVYYLIQNEYGDMMVAAYRSNRYGETWWEQMYPYESVEDEVVAWMPLPKPWKGE